MSSGALISQSAPDYVLHEHPAIQYASRAPRDRVARLRQSLVDGGASLRFDGPTGYLKSVLQALRVPEESQLLIFSKTGIQGMATSPRNPRALYFNDSVVVGYITGARFIELAAHDPEQGVMFYTLEQTAASAPTFERPRSCITCHVSSHTLDVPGMLVRSIFTNARGEAIPQLGFHVVNHTTQFPQRWGGWFVTGDYARHPYVGLKHMGNQTVSSHAQSMPLATSNEVFSEWLGSAPDTRGYLSAESDIAALMLFDHQMHAINLLTRLNWEARVGGKVADLIGQTVEYFLFVGAADPPARILPRRAFADAFVGRGPRDRAGRSLRELDLDTRLMKYPLSYMIYSDAFDHLPPAIRQTIYERVWAALAKRADGPAIVQMLRDTKTDLPDNLTPLKH